MVKITVDYDRCESFGMCCMDTPDLFQLDDDDKLQHVVEADESRREELVMAARQCPTRSITID